MHRIFAALPVSETVSERLLTLRDDLTGARWRRLDHHHITLQFFGNVERHIAEEIADQLDQIVMPGFEISLQGVGWFGRKEPRLLYARVVDSPALTDLSESCRAIAHRLNVPIEKKLFKPHITLAYCNDTPLDQAMAWSEQYQELRTEPLWVDQFHLYESFTGGPRQSRYEIQASYSLG